MEGELVPVASDEYYKMMEREWALDIREQRKIVRSSGSQLVSDAGIKRAVEMSRSYNVPLGAICFIPAGKEMIPYVTAEGIKWAYRLDTRGAAGIITTFIQFPTPEVPVAICRAEVKFRDGSCYVGHGLASPDQKANKDMSLPDIAMKAETKSVRRAIQNAIAFPFSVYEDAIEVAERGWQAMNKYEEKLNTVDGTATELVENMPAVFAVAMNELKIPYLETVEILKKLLGVEEPLSYGDPAGALEQLKKYVEK
jgi:hypothetical protein